MNDHDPNPNPDRLWVIELFKSLIDGLPIEPEQKRFLNYRLAPLFDSSSMSVAEWNKRIKSTLQNIPTTLNKKQEKQTNEKTKEE